MPSLLRETLPWIAALTAIGLTLLDPNAASSLAPWIFLSSAIILGVPHGACDPWIPGWVRHRPSHPIFLVLFMLTYLGLSALYLVLWRNFPFPSTLFFLLLTAWHWGSADASLEFHPGTRWLGLALARGSMVMLAPFAFQPFEAWQVMKWMAPAAPECPAHSLLMLGIGISLTLLALARPAPKTWLETLILLALFYLTPPLLSVGIYFMAFHAWRHLLRISALRDGLISDSTLPWLKSLTRLLLLSAPLTLATLFFLPWIPSWAHAQIYENWVGPYLVLLAVLTLPHAILVGWLDREVPFVKS